MKQKKPIVRPNYTIFLDASDTQKLIDLARQRKQHKSEIIRMAIRILHENPELMQLKKGGE